jgi:hypothetical protein
MLKKKVVKQKSQRFRWIESYLQKEEDYNSAERYNGMRYELAVTHTHQLRFIMSVQSTITRGNTEQVNSK